MEEASVWQEVTTYREQCGIHVCMGDFFSAKYKRNNPHEYAIAIVPIDSKTKAIVRNYVYFYFMEISSQG